MRHANKLTAAISTIQQKQSSVSDEVAKFYDSQISSQYDKPSRKSRLSRFRRQRPLKPVREETLQPVPYYRLFRFVNCTDVILLIIGTVGAAVASTCIPLLTLLFGEMTELMAKTRNEICCSGKKQIPCNATANVTAYPSDLYGRMHTCVIGLTIVGVVQLISGYVFVSMFARVGERQVYKLRVCYLSSLLKQSISWYDTAVDRNFVSKISENVSKVQNAIGDKVGMCVYYFLGALVNIIIAFWYGWLLSLVILSTAPVIVIAAVITTTIQSRLALREQQEYSKAALIAQEALSNIKTVVAFGGQDKEILRFEMGLSPASGAGIRRGFASALGNGILWLLNYLGYALAMWYGAKLLFQSNRCNDPEYEIKTVVVVLFTVMTAAFNVGQALSYFEVFAIARGAAASIYKVIDSESKINGLDSRGKIPINRISGLIEFKGVKFSYPSRKSVQILDGFNLVVQPGSTVALVGNSGCGKSTCLQLLQRFYDADQGSVLIDGNNIKDLDLHWYRSQVGVVSQEPILFGTTIAENIRYGKNDATFEEILEACKLSNAHQFIEKLPGKYDTMVGERGAQLSGGQKQRIAIARALIKNPSILLLDEATSALDTQSEVSVQKALDKARQGRTTLIVAQRLSTVQDADAIVALKNGHVAEMGSHDELLAKKGLYFGLVTAQIGYVPKGASEGEGDEGKNNTLDVSSPQEEQTVTEHENMFPSQAEEEKLFLKKGSFLKLLRLHKQDWYWIALGLLMALVNGASLPIYAYLFGKYSEALATGDPRRGLWEANECALAFIILAFYAGISAATGLSAFNLAGERLTNRLRRMLFVTMMEQDLEWYDSPKNSVGSLTSRLSGDASSVQEATGMRLGTIAQAFTTIGTSVVLSLVVSYRLGLVAIAFTPLILAAGYYNGKMLENQQIEEKFAAEQASSYAFQALSGIRTVASLCQENKFVEMYSEVLYGPYKKAVRNTHILGLVYGFSQGFMYFAYATVFYYGAQLIKHENEPFTNVFVVSEALIWSMQMLGQTLAFATNYKKAKVAGGRIIILLNQKPKMIRTRGVGKEMPKCEGKIDFVDVEFSYPLRPQIKILNGLTFSIEPRTHVGICGPSGSGKSTCIQLIQRYYDSLSGSVCLDQINVQELNVDYLRSQMAIVSQEPVLFDRTMAENIAYGDNSREVPLKEIIEAARAANIHHFISTLPLGYATRVGDMGSQLSGGQKQRVAIARALVRKPKVLLLDEATSALDTESEKLVQDALESAMEGRTSVTVAHRLSSIKNADRILVLVAGKLTESGTHDELLGQKGIYFKLWTMQHHKRSDKDSVSSYGS